MTSTAAHSPPARLAADPAAVAALAIAAVAAATLAGAWFFQLVLDIRPCPLCLEQRYAYYLALPLALVVAFAASRGAPRQLVLAGFAVLLLAALANAWLGGYHAGVDGSSGRARPIAPARSSISAAPARCCSGSTPSR